MIKEKGIKSVYNSDNSKYPSSYLWNEKEFFEKAGPNPKGFLRELHDFCCQQPGIVVHWGKGNTKASFSVRCSAVGAPKGAILGVNYDGTIWPYFSGLPEPIGSQYRNRIGRIERVKITAEEKDWFKFTLLDSKELKILTDTLKYLATLEW